MQGNSASSTAPEQALRSELHRRGLRFRKHHRAAAGVRCRADVVFPTERLAIFVDGCFWHRCPEHGVSPRTNSDYWREKLDRNVARDRRIDDALAEGGWLVLRAWEHEDPVQVADRVAEAVTIRRLMEVRPLPRRTEL